MSLRINENGGINMANDKIKELIKKNHLCSWQIAKVLEVHESVLSRWFREPLTNEQERLILLAIEKLKLEQKHK
jgi:hypothetical protein